MKNPRETILRYKALLSVSLVAVLGAILAIGAARVSSQSPVDVEVTARNLVAVRSGLAPGEVEVVHTAKMEFKKRAVTAFKLMDNRSGEIYEVALDERGREVDVEKLLAEERAEREARYGKLDPALAERLANSFGDDPVEVIIWLKKPFVADDDRPLPFEVEQFRSDDGQKQTAPFQSATITRMRSLSSRPVSAACTNCALGRGAVKPIRSISPSHGTRVTRFI